MSDRMIHGVLTGFIGDSQFTATRDGYSWNFVAIDTVNGQQHSFKCNDYQAGAIMALMISGGFGQLSMGRQIDDIFYSLSEQYMPVDDNGESIVDGRRLIP